MKVKELIAKLQEFDGERLVVMSSDGEGNRYSSLYSISTGGYSHESGEVNMEPDDLIEELRAQGYSEEDIAEEGYTPALVLHPAT